MFERKLVKLLRRLPEWLVVSVAFLVIFVTMFAMMYLVTRAHYALSTLFGGV